MASRICPTRAKSTDPPRRSREVPVFEAAAVVLDVDVTHEVFDLVELVARIGAVVVVGDVAGVEVEADVRVIDVAHQAQHGLRVLRGPLVRFGARSDRTRRQRLRADGGADDRTAFRVIGRLAGA